MKKSAYSKPLVDHMYTADPAVKVFEDKLYIYPSHDLGNENPDDGSGDHFWMEDYHVFSMDDITAPCIDHGEAIHLDDVAWAHAQFWDNDVAHKDGKYYMYFPSKDEAGIFRIGVAIADAPSGPFIPEPQPMKDVFSIDPHVFADDDGTYYMYYGGLWGGQMEKWQTGEFVQGPPNNQPGIDGPKGDEPALLPYMVVLSDDMLQAKSFHRIEILDEFGELLKASDTDRRFFEASWLHKYNGKYYFSYSTGDTHNLCYAEGTSPFGPFTYKGVLLEPVIGWTNHHSVVEFKGKWYLFYHDSTISGGHTQLRGMKFTELEITEDGTITTNVAYQTEEEILEAAALMLKKSDLETVKTAFKLSEELVSKL